MQMTAAPKGQSSAITGSFPHFSRVFHSVTPGFQRLPSIHFRENWGKLYRKRLFAVSSVPFKTEKRFLLVAEESNTTAVVLCTELWSGLGYQECVLVSV